MKRLLYFVWATVVFLLPNQAYGQELTLEEAIATALEQHNLIRASKSEVASREAGIGIARSLLLPKLYVDEGFIRTDNPAQTFTWKLNQERFSAEDFAIPTLNNPLAISNFQTYISFEHTIFDLKSWLGLGIAKRHLQTSQYDFEQRKENVAFNVFDAYLSVQTAQAHLQAAEAAVTEAKEHLRTAKVKAEGGLGLKSDELRAMVFLSEAEEEKIRAVNDLDIAKHSLALAIGSEAGSCFGAKERLTERPIEKDVSELVKEALIRRNDLRGMESRVQNAGNEVRVAKADYLPTAYFSGAYELDDHRAPFRSEGSNWLLMVRLRWEAFDGLRRMAQMAKAKRIRHSSEEILEGMRKDVAFRVREKYLRLQEAKKRLEIAEKALTDAKEGIRLMKVRYKNALSSIVELLDAQTALNTARYNVVKTYNDYLLSQAEVRHQAGAFLRSVLEN